MGRPENFLIDCHVDFLNCSDFRWISVGTRLRVASMLEAVYDPSGPALRGNAAMTESYSGTIHRNRARLQ